MTCRGNGKQAVFLDVADRVYFLKLLRSVVRAFDWQCLTYCLMDNHYHLLVRTLMTNLGAGMRRLNGRYAQRFNLRHDRVGHLWGDRYHSVLLEREAHVPQAIGYIALNPVRAGLCDRPEAWRWSAHRVLVGLDTDTVVAARVSLGYFSAMFGGDGLARYREFVADQT